MGYVYKCDRCGQLDIPYRTDEELVIIDRSKTDGTQMEFNYHSLDLCEECEKELRTWLNVYKPTKNARRKR